MHFLIDFFLCDLCDCFISASRVVRLLSSLPAASPVERQSLSRPAKTETNPRSSVTPWVSSCTIIFAINFVAFLIHDRRFYLSALFSRWCWQIPSQGHPCYGQEEGREEIQGEAFHQDRQLQPPHAYQVLSFVIAHWTSPAHSLTSIASFLCSLLRYSVDIDLKKAVDENSLAENNRASSRKAVKKIFEDRYRSATANKSEKKAAGTQYFFEKLKF